MSPKFPVNHSHGVLLMVLNLMWNGQLVITHKNVGEIGANIFLPLDPDFDAANPQDRFGPWDMNIRTIQSAVFVEEGQQHGP